jgi:L-alanine-DL-glutamate epimerase-like enolase superfamily enzyme
LNVEPELDKKAWRGGNPSPGSLFSSVGALFADEGAGVNKNVAQELFFLHIIQVNAIAADDIEGCFWLKEKLRGESGKLPILANESAKTSKDIAKLAGTVEGVVVQTMKTEGLREGLRAIDMKIMFLCRMKTSMDVAAAAHLVPLCEFADLNGRLLIKNDPCRGLRDDGALISLPNALGIGLERVA